MTTEFAGLSTEEQEVSINIARGEAVAYIYASDSNWIKKLDKKYKRTREHIQNGKLAAAEYEIPVKHLKISPPRKSTMTEEQRKAKSEQMKAMRAQQLANKAQ